MRLMERVLLSAILLGATGVAHAEGIVVSPVLVRFAPGQLASTLTATNNSTRRVSVQLRSFAWDQTDGVDHLTATESLAVSPPITEIEPGATQTFRVVLRETTDDREASYRLLLDEIPPPAAPGFVAVALRMSLPVFTTPEARAVVTLAWRVVVAGSGARLVARNSGNQHTRILNARINAAGLTIRPNANPYVLAGAERSWQVDGGTGLRPGGSVRLTAMSDAGPIDASIPVIDR